RQSAARAGFRLPKDGEAGCFRRRSRFQYQRRAKKKISGLPGRLETASNSGGTHSSSDGAMRRGNHSAGGFLALQTPPFTLRGALLLSLTLINASNRRQCLNRAGDGGRARPCHTWWSNPMKKILMPVIAGLALVAATFAYAADATGTIKAVDATARTVTLDDSKVYVFPASVD